jgi:hypothetical protein
LPQAAATAAAGAAGVAATTNLTQLLPTLQSLPHDCNYFDIFIKAAAAWHDATNYCTSPRFMRCVLSFKLPTPNVEGS